MIFGCFVGRFVSVRGGSMFIERKVRVFPLTEKAEDAEIGEANKVRNRWERKNGSEVSVVRL